MLVAHVFYPVEVLGPGKRIGIWMCGCKRRCKGCITPQLQDFDRKRNIPVEGVMALVQQVATKHHVDGITISGGEPFEQADELAVLLGELGKEYEDILVYSGYTYGQLVGLGQNAVDAVLDNIAVLIDGEYREDRNQGHPLKGSENQRIHYMKPECREKYEMYIEEMYGKKRVQNFPIQGGVFSVGIHESRFEERLSEGLQRQGILKRKEE